MGTKTTSFHPAHYSVRFLYSTRPLIYSPNRLSLKKTIRRSTIYTFHSSSSSFPPTTNSSVPQLLSPYILSFIDWTYRLDGVRFRLLKLPDVFSGAPFFFYWCRKHLGLQAESHTWHHPPWWLSKPSTRQKSLYIAGVVDIPYASTYT